MALRSFRDSAGTDWEVWDVRPPPRPVSYLPKGAQETGWLAFRSGGAMRRLRPIPDGWETCSESDLEHFCQLATPGRQRT